VIVCAAHGKHRPVLIITNVMTLISSVPID
jgi:hypothetical protein